MALDTTNLFCGYQKEWINDPSPLSLWEKSRRIGATWCHGFRVVVNRAGSHPAMPFDYWHSSTDMTAGAEFIGYCAEWCKMMNEVAQVVDAEEVVDEQKINTLQLRFANGLKIVAGSSNPKFFRSKGGEAGLDEFAFHAQGRELMKAAHATALFWGYPLRAWSSHNGPGSYFNQRVVDANAGRLKARVHRVTILDAVEQGIVERIIMRKQKLDHVPAPDAKARQEWLDELHATCPDEDTWNEEYLCIPSSDASSLLSYDLIQGCEVNLQLIDPAGLPREGEPIYAGFDVGRKRDLSSLWGLGKVGDVFWTRFLRVLQGVSFSAQEGVLNALLANPRVKRLCIDSTGIGMQLAERLQERWGKYRVEAVHFTAPVKSELAMPVRRLFEDKLVRIPRDDQVREDLHSIRKIVTAANNVRLDVDRSDTDGHGDRFWSLALAYHAAEAKRFEGRVISSGSRPVEL